MNRLFLPLAALLLMVGCASNRQETFELSVKNQTSTPISIWLTKDGPPDEQGWESPEQLALLPQTTTFSFTTVEPGKVAHAGPLTGQFAPGVNAWLRVYQGLHTLDEILAISRGSHDRLDYLTLPGKHRLTIVEQDGRLIAQETDIQP
ncbi:MAG: hypothetical protein IT447_06195 [Phycisphaerales bacterium]|jgi:hypothetical protein|nr:hypothetical protein [Phycisphaerales bacterium]